MTTPLSPSSLDGRPARSARDQRAGLLVFALLAAGGLIWAKWAPYWDRIPAVAAAGEWSGKALFDLEAGAGSGPSLSAGWDFTVAYTRAVWKALLVGLVLAAAVDALLPRRSLLAALRRRTTVGSSLAGGLASLPAMMCTCCATPLAATMRRDGVPTAGAVAWWLGNPVLNPAVIVFLALVLPWEFAATRLGVGLLLVVGGSVAVARLVRGEDQADLVAAQPETATGDAPLRFVRTLGRLLVTLVPEYLVVVFAVGALRGWLFPLDGSAASWGVVAVLVAAVVGTLVVIPTGGEIPVIIGLAALGVSPAVLGALLLTLPAISLPSMVMAGRALTWPVVGATAGVVAAAGLMAAAVLPAMA